jgi:hypothetical protein
MADQKPPAEKKHRQPGNNNCDELTDPDLTDERYGPVQALPDGWLLPLVTCGAIQQVLPVTPTRTQLDHK